MLEFTVEDHGVPYAPGEVFILTGEDNYCLHPDSPQPLMVQVSYGQRYPKGTLVQISYRVSG